MSRTDSTRNVSETSSNTSIWLSPLNVVCAPPGNAMMPCTADPSFLPVPPVPFSARLPFLNCPLYSVIVGRLHNRLPICTQRSLLLHRDAASVIPQPLNLSPQQEEAGVGV